MEETQVMLSAPSLVMLSKQREHVFVLDEELYDVHLATESGEAAILDELGRLRGAGNVGRSSLEAMYVVPQIECHAIVHDITDKVVESCVEPEHDGKGLVVVTEHNNLARPQQLSSSLLL